MRDKVAGGRRSAPTAGASRGAAARRVRARGAASEVAHDLLEEPGVGVDLRNIPRHDTAEAAVRLGPLDGGLELGTVGIAAAATRGTGDAEHQLDVLVGARRLGPVVPDVKVEGILGRGALDKVGHSAPVVVELDHEEVECNAIHGRLVGGVGEDALRSGRQVELLAAGAVHEAAELLAESGQVVGGGLEVEVEAVHHGRAKGAVDVLAHGAEHVPDHLRGVLRVACAAPAALSISRAAERQDDGLAASLARLDVGPRE